MYRKYFVGIGVGILASVLISTPISALVDESRYEVRWQAEGASTQSSTSNVDPAKELAERIEKRKQDTKPNLTVVQRKRLVERCKNSQTALRSASDKISVVETRRTEAYKTIANSLTSISSKTDKNNKNVQKLDEQKNDFVTRIAAHDALVLKYKQSLADTLAIDCTADILGFKASLEAARQSFKEIRQSNSEMRDKVKKEIKPTLTLLRSELVDGSASGRGN